MRMLVAAILLFMLAPILLADSPVNFSTITLPPTLGGGQVFFLQQAVSNGSNSQTPQVVVISSYTDVLENLYRGIDDGFLKQPSPLAYPWWFVIGILGILIFATDDNKTLQRTVYGYRLSNKRTTFALISAAIAAFVLIAHYGDLAKMMGG